VYPGASELISGGKFPVKQGNYREFSFSNPEKPKRGNKKGPNLLEFSLKFPNQLNRESIRGPSGIFFSITGTYFYPKIFEISFSTGPLSDALVVEASAKGKRIVRLFGALLALVYHCFDRIVILSHLPLLTLPKNRALLP
jgi:hypothetical protein